jgi:hypothetical protein
MIRESRILRGIGDDEHVALADGLAAEEVRIRKLTDIHAVRRFEEQPVRVDQTHQGYRRLADVRRERGQFVEASLPTRVEHAVAAQSGQSRALLSTGRLTPRDHGA